MTSLELKKKSLAVREDILTGVHSAKSGHPGGSLSAADIFTCLYFEVLRIDPENAGDDERSSAYQTVYRLGALTRDERDEGKTVTRALLVKYLLNAADYGSVARLSGIFTCSYADRGAIPADSLGYAALAQGFGLVRGDSFDGETAATRAVAAVMLCRLMEREQ